MLARPPNDHPRDWRSPNSQDRPPSPGPLKRQIAGAGVAIGARQLLVHGANIVGGALLARLLPAADFGVYALVLFVVTFLAVFGGTGLAANLIRDEDAPSTADLQAVFTAQETLVIAIALVVAISSKPLASWYHIGPNGSQLFLLVAASLVVTSLQAIPQVRLERDLRFQAVAMIEAAQAITFNGLAVLLAWQGFGAGSFGWAILARALIGAGLANATAPWPVAIRFDTARLARHLRFGLLFLGSNVISLIKDSINPLFIGLLLGMSVAGYVNWALMVASYACILLMGLQRLYMPSFAKMMAHPAELGPLVETALFFVNMVAAPISLLTLALITPITILIFGAKWIGAIPLFYLFWAANLLVPTATPLLGLLNAAGRAKSTFAFTIIWLAMIWGLGAPLILAYGAIGLGVASIITQFTVIALVRSARRITQFRVLGPALKPWLAALPALAILTALDHLKPATSWPNLALYALCGLTIYLLTNLAIHRRRATQALRTARALVTAWPR